MTGSSATSMFATLLDRSVARVGELAADGRFFDREEVVRIADIWDNNTFPLFAVALSRPAWLRERHARAALMWMAEAGPERRAWMIEQAATAGHRLESTLGPYVPGAPHHRDHLGLVRPGVVPLTPAAAAGVADDYDLDRAEVRTVRVERAGQRLSGSLALVVQRRYAGPAGHTEAIVQVFLRDVRSVHVDSRDRRGAVLMCTASGVEVRTGTHGHLRAGSAVLTIEDPTWHLSRAGRAADVGTPHLDSARRRRDSSRPQPRGPVHYAPIILHQSMLEIRSVRYAKTVGRVPLHELSVALTGAGASILAAANRSRREREKAFGQLAEEWISRSPYLAHLVTRRLPSDPWVHKMGSTVPYSATVAGLPECAQLTLAGYTAAHTHFGTQRAASVATNLAVPNGDRKWVLRAMEFPDAGPFTLSSAAFTSPRTAHETPGVALSLGPDAMTIARSAT